MHTQNLHLASTSLALVDSRIHRLSSLAAAQIQSLTPSQSQEPKYYCQMQELYTESIFSDILTLSWWSLLIERGKNHVIWSSRGRRQLWEWDFAGEDRKMEADGDSGMGGGLE